MNKTLITDNDSITFLLLSCLSNRIGLLPTYLEYGKQFIFCLILS